MLKIPTGAGGPTARHRWPRSAVAIVVACALSGIAAPVAQAAPASVRGDSDAVHASVTSVSTNFPN
ncbi:MAG: hypothetical protein AAGC63_07205, partial [Propionicimonas sp.]